MLLIAGEAYVSTVWTTAFPEKTCFLPLGKTNFAGHILVLHSVFGRKGSHFRNSQEGDACPVDRDG